MNEDVLGTIPSEKETLMGKLSPPKGEKSLRCKLFLCILCVYLRARAREGETDR